MKPRNLLSVGAVIAVCVISVLALSQSRRPDFSGRWTLVEGSPGGNSPIGSEGTITQDGASLNFRSSTSSRLIPFDGSTTTRQDNAYVWEEQGRWAGLALIVSMKARSGQTPGSFEDLMILSLSAADTMTMVLMRTTMAGTMQTYTLTYKKN